MTLIENMDQDVKLANAIKNEKIQMKLKQRLEASSNDKLREKIFFNKLVKNLLNEFNQKIIVDYDKFKEITNIFADNNIEIILIKSDNSFPFESDNMDTLIRSENFSKVVNLLGKARFSELALIREPHKFLFRNSENFSILPVHIHTMVEWEGTQFVASAELWKRKQFSDDNLFFVPGPEDCILITIAHLFFENHKIKLADLLKVQSKIIENDIDWNYLFLHAEKLHWLDALSMTLILMDKINKQLFGKPLLNQREIEKIKSFNFLHVNIALKINEILYPPTKIPYIFSALFFLRRVLLHSNWSKKRRLQHISWITSDIIRRRLPGRKMSHLEL
jgi:hypothetical protein